MSFDAIKWRNDYNREKYDKITIVIPKGEKDEWKALAQSYGISMSEMIRRAVADFSEK